MGWTRHGDAVRMRGPSLGTVPPTIGAEVGSLSSDVALVL
jgi:hypothetical protein